MGFLMPTHSLTIFEMQKYYENESRFNGVYSRNNLPKEITQPASDVPGTSPEGPLKVLTSGTSRGPSGDS